MSQTTPVDVIRSRSYPSCYLCGSPGLPLHRGLVDRLFDAPGSWDVKKCPDPGCGLLWLDPIPSERDIAKAYRGYFTHRERKKSSGDRRRHVLRDLGSKAYLARRFDVPSARGCRRMNPMGLLVYLRPGRRAVLDARGMYLTPIPGGRLLDVGCGSGKLLRVMQEIGWQVEGVDVDPAALEIARRRGLCVNLGTLENQGYPDGQFDAVVLNHVIEHVHEPLELLRECRRVLGPRGHLTVVTPNNESWGHQLFRENWRGLEPPRHLHIFSSQSLRSLALRAGFSEPRLITTIRSARKIFAASRSIASARSGAKLGSPSRAARALAKAMELIEWAMLKARPTVGEELVLVATK